MKSLLGLRYRSLFHWIAGIITALSGLIGTEYVITSAAIFIAYQVLEEWRKRDSSFWDILEYMIAYYAVVVIFIIGRLLR